jgi:endonuclease G
MLTFLMSNMMPQVHELNAGPWEQLEQRERECAAHRRELYIVAGGIFDAEPKTIGHGVEVPRANFKIIVELDHGQGAGDVTPTTRAVAVIMPNEATASVHEWTDYLTSVDRVEAATGYDFLPAVSEPVQREIEARVGSPADL